MTHDYRDEIRSDIAHEFGLKALGYDLPRVKLPIQVAQRIVCKYPHIEHPKAVKDRSYYEMNPKALLIAKRYVAIFGRYL